MSPLTTRWPVLVLTDRLDTTADYVVDELNRRGCPVFRCDTGDFPAHLTVTARLGSGWSGSVRLPERVLALDDVGCAYWRRPSAFEFPEGLNDEERRWSGREARRGFGGVLAALPRWLNHPSHVAAAEYKPVQLVAARAVGLAVPPTIVTNDPAEARMFVDEVGAAVYKPLGGGAITEQGVHKLTYANRITSDDIDDSVRGTAHLFQAWVPKSHEVRLTVVDRDMFAIRIDCDSAAGHLDWRTDYPGLRYSLTAVPDEVRNGVHRLLDRLRLRFGAVDFVVGHDDSWSFLEVNANGQWAWLQDATGAPIAASIADALMRDDR